MEIVYIRNKIIEKTGYYFHVRDNFGLEYGKFSHILGTFVLIEKHFFRFLNSLINFLGIVTYQQYVGLEFLSHNHLYQKIVYTDFQQVCVKF